MNEATNNTVELDVTAPVRDAIKATEFESKAKMDEYCLQQRRNAAWPLVCAGIASVGWIIPLIGIPFSIAAVVGGCKAHRNGVLTVGVISLALSCINFGIGFMIGLNM